MPYILSARADGFPLGIPAYSLDSPLFFGRGTTHKFLKLCASSTVRLSKPHSSKNT